MDPRDIIYHKPHCRYAQTIPLGIIETDKGKTYEILNKLLNKILDEFRLFIEKDSQHSTATIKFPFEDEDEFFWENAITLYEERFGPQPTSIELTSNGVVECLCDKDNTKMFLRFVNLSKVDPNTKNICELCSENRLDLYTLGKVIQSVIEEKAGTIGIDARKIKRWAKKAKAPLVFIESIAP